MLFGRLFNKIKAFINHLINKLKNMFLFKNIQIYAIERYANSSVGQRFHRSAQVKRIKTKIY